MRKAEIITAFILGLFSLSIMWKSGEGPSWDPDVSRFDNIGFIDGEGPGSGFWPFWLSLVMFICCLWIAYNWYKRTSPPSQSEKTFLDATGVRLVLEVSGGLIGFLLLIFVVGFYAAMFVFLIYYIKILGKHRWKTTLL
ncbi:MAG: tripartite tricarboxylate transporter TctB family protein, partial [Proteobacteria bacterium]|nr:tripartite tricarboxylate transporter TctB family protein [Pseudomonadota bacterium]